MEKKVSFPLYRAIPSIITICALCTGLTGVCFAINYKFAQAIICITIAAVLDTLDGRMARFLKAGSDFGAILDSLADFASFGVAPAIMIYLWSLHELQRCGWAITLFFPVCCALRLARFNTSTKKKYFFASHYFQGVPAPAGAGLCLLPIIMTFAWDLSIKKYTYGIAAWVFFIGILSVSTIPTFSFKKLHITFRWVIPLIVGVALFITFAVNKPWAALSIFLINYGITIFFSALRYRYLSKIEENKDHTSSNLSDDNDKKTMA